MNPSASAALDQVTVLTVTYNSAHCIAPLAAGLAGLPHVIVVDNASADDSCDQVRAHLPAARLLVMPVNRGYGAANNAGLAEVATPYALLLNPDCLVQPEQIAALVQGAQAWPDATLVVPQLTEASGALQVNYSWPRAAWAPKTGGAEGPLDVGYACAAAMLVRMQDLPRIGGAFDPLFFLYYEDEDLCLRVFQARRQILVLPEIRITHLSRGSVRGSRPWRAEYWRGYHHVQSKILFAWKHAGPEAAQRLRRHALLAAALNLAARCLLPSPKHLARAWGRLRGLGALDVAALAQARRAAH